MLNMKKRPNIYEIREEGYLGVDFYLSKSCNKSCHYCTAWTLEMRNLHVDMEFLTRTLNGFDGHSGLCKVGEIMRDFI